MAKKKELTIDEFIETMSDEMNAELSDGRGDDEETDTETLEERVTHGE